MFLKPNNEVEVEDIIGQLATSSGYNLLLFFNDQDLYNSEVSLKRALAQTTAKHLLKLNISKFDNIKVLNLNNGREQYFKNTMNLDFCTGSIVFKDGQIILKGKNLTMFDLVKKLNKNKS